MFWFFFQAVCAGRTNLNGACHRSYSDDKIIYRGGRTQNYGGGTCTQPNNCENCNQGFYNDGRGYCSSMYIFCNKVAVLMLFRICYN